MKSNRLGSGDSQSKQRPGRFSSRRRLLRVHEEGDHEVDGLNHGNGGGRICESKDERVSKSSSVSVMKGERRVEGGV